MKSKSLSKGKQEGSDTFIRYILGAISEVGHFKKEKEEKGLKIRNLIKYMTEEYVKCVLLLFS